MSHPVDEWVRVAAAVDCAAMYMYVCSLDADDCMLSLSTSDGVIDLD